MTAEIPNFWPDEAEVPRTIKGLIEAAEEAMKSLADVSDRMSTTRETYVNRFDPHSDIIFDPDLLAYIDQVACYTLAASRMGALHHLMMLKILSRLPPDPEEPFEPER